MIPDFPQFKRLSIEDGPELDGYMRQFPAYSNYTFASLWAWDIRGFTELSMLNGNLVVKFADYVTSDPLYSFFGNKHVDVTTTALLDFSEAAGLPAELHFVPELSVFGLANARVLYRRLPRLFEELGLAKASGTYAKTLAKLASADVLVLDDLGIKKILEAERNDLLEVLEDRYGRTSTVVTSQLPIGKWHEWLGDPTAADAILDRLVHNAYKLELKGASRRKEIKK